MSDAVCRIVGVRRRRGGAFCLRVDELGVRRGEVFSLLGPTGAGKSTLLRLLTGLEAPEEGTVLFRGERLHPGAPPALLRAVAMVHQSPILLRGPVRDSVAYGLRVRGLPAEPKVSEVLERLGLAALARQDARSLSGGQVQLVALARALVLEPELLLLDEPTAHLDPARVALAERTVAEARVRRDTAVVWATHNLFQARRVSDRAALLLDGGLVEVARTRQFFESPGDPRTAAFLNGEMIY